MKHIELKGDEALELEYIPLRFPGVNIVLDTIQTNKD